MHDFTILVVSGTHASSVATTLDILHAAAALAPRLKAPRPSWRLVSPRGGAVALSSGLQVATATLPRTARTDRSDWIVPGLGIDSARDVAARLASADAQHAVRALQAHAAAGGTVAASCTGVFLLQAAGLLAGRQATTSWWLAAELRRLAPRCTVVADRMVCSDGLVTTAGAAFAQTDLVLQLLRARCGQALVDAVRRVLLIDARQAQSPYIVPMMLSNGDDLVARLSARIEAALPHPPSVALLAQEFAMSTRTLARHVKAATGQSTLMLLQAVRLQRARMLIESSKMPIARVAQEVGYENATALRRLMRKFAGANPGQFRVQTATTSSGQGRNARINPA